jgi:hypothetical protein
MSSMLLPAPRLLAVVLALSAAGCAAKMTTQQALVEDAFQACRAQGPSTKLDRVDRDGRFSVVGPQAEAQRVRDCMIRHAEAPPPSTVSATSGSVASPLQRPEPLVSGRLPGTWRGTLRLSAQSGDAAVTSPATVRFVVVAGALRWTLAAGQVAPSVAGDGTAVVVDGELRMTGSVRPPAPRASSPEASRAGVSVRYAGTLVGDRLEVTGVTADRQVHVLFMRRVGE